MAACKNRYLRESAKKAGFWFSQNTGFLPYFSSALNFSPSGPLSFSGSVPFPYIRLNLIQQFSTIITVDDKLDMVGFADCYYT